MISNYVVFDIETTGLSAIYDCGRVTCICAKSSTNEKFSLVLENEAELILRFIGWLYKYDPKHFWLVSHNGKSFDAQYLYIRLAELTNRVSHFDHFKRFNHFDTFHEYKERFSKWVSLNKLAGMLGLPIEKSGDGLQAIKWWHDGEWDKLLKYCETDVEVTEQVFLAFQKKFPEK